MNILIRLHTREKHSRLMIKSVKQRTKILISTLFSKRYIYLRKRTLETLPVLKYIIYQLCTTRNFDLLDMFESHDMDQCT